MRKAIFITGGGSGIGRATAHLFASKSWFVGLADVDEAGMVETRAAIGEAGSRTYTMDVRNRAQWQSALADFWADAGERLDVLFLNAGIARGGAFVDMPARDHDDLIDINLKGVIYGAEAGFDYLKRTPGSCLLSSCSAAGLHGAPGLATYAASKFGVRGLTEGLDVEWAAHGIKARTIMPGFIDTPLLKITTSGTNRSAREGVVDAGLEFTPVEQVAQAAWNAVHGDRVHVPVGKTARRLAFMSRWLPGVLRRGMHKNARTV